MPYAVGMSNEDERILIRRRETSQSVRSGNESMTKKMKEKKRSRRTSLYHLESHVCVDDATARTGFSATNEITLFTR